MTDPNPTDPASADPPAPARPSADPLAPAAPEVAELAMAERASDSRNAAPEVVERTEVRVRRAPRLASFLIAGLALGVILALIATFAFPSTPDFATSQIFGFLLLLGAVVGTAIGAIVALVVGRVLERRTRQVTAERESTPPLPEP